MIGSKPLVSVCIGVEIFLDSDASLKFIPHKILLTEI